MNDGQALYKTICENPDEDTPRLAYADWLDEQGEHEYAQYIRWSISIVNPPDEESFENVMEWGEREKWCREFERKNQPLLRGLEKLEREYKVVRPPLKYKYERGFIQSVGYTIYDIFLPGMYNGTREGLWTYREFAERLVRETPITCLMLSDVYPYSYTIANVQRVAGRIRMRALYKYRWLQMTEDDAGDMDDISDASFGGMLPQWLFDLMWYNKLINTCNKATVMSQPRLSTRYIEFDTREQAKEALGEVLGRDIRERVYGRKK